MVRYDVLVLSEDVSIIIHPLKIIWVLLMFSERPAVLSNILKKTLRKHAI